MFAKTNHPTTNSLAMKFSRSRVHSKTHALPTLRFEEQRLTSFSGLVIYQRLFESLALKKRLRDCFRHTKVTPIFGQANIVLLLVIHLLLGYRELRHIKYYEDDPMVHRLLGLKHLPDVATVSRHLANMDERSIDNLSKLQHNLVLDRLSALSIKRITLDFDGSVIGTGRYAEGGAIGFNKKKKGQRSYYPLFCTVAQTGQVLGILHRSGNVHDSNGAKAFILACIAHIRERLPDVTIETRMDSAFFSDAIVSALNEAKIEYSISVPFERFPELKTKIEQRCRWHRLDELHDYFESSWKPAAWSRRHRFILVRQKTKIQYKKPVQLDLFVPYEYGYAFKVVLTNKTLTAPKVVVFHNGRGSQEGVFSELKSQNQMGYIPTKTWKGNQIYLLSVTLAHNLSRELQMLSRPPARGTQEKRPALWKFEKIDTLRRRLIQRAGRLIRPRGELTLSMSANQAVQDEIMHYLDNIPDVA